MQKFLFLFCSLLNWQLFGSQKSRGLELVQGSRQTQLACSTGDLSQLVLKALFNSKKFAYECFGSCSRKSEIDIAAVQDVIKRLSPRGSGAYLSQDRRDYQQAIIDRKPSAEQNFYAFQRRTLEEQEADARRRFENSFFQGVCSLEETEESEFLLLRNRLFGASLVPLCPLSRQQAHSWEALKASMSKLVAKWKVDDLAIENEKLLLKLRFTTWRSAIQNMKSATDQCDSY